MKQYEIYNSTSEKFIGTKFMCEHETLCTACLDLAINYSLEEDKLNKEGGIYVYSDSHIILLIKEVK